MACFPHRSLFDAPARGTHFGMKLTPQKLEGYGMTVWCKFHNHNFVLYYTPVWQTDGGTDGRAIACSRSRSSKHALCCQPVAC